MTTNFPAVANVGSDLQAALGQSKVKETAQGGMQHMRFGAYTGEWSYGKEGLDITDEEIIVNTQSLQHGWVQWCNQKPTERMVSFVEDLPIPMEDVKDKKGVVCQAQEARGFQAMLPEDDGTHTLVSFVNNSFGARKGVDVLMNAIRVKAGTTADFLYPKVRLTEDGNSYENPNKKGETIFNPMFEIVSWHNMAGDVEGEAATQVEDQSDPEPEVKEEEAPKTNKRRRRKAS